MRVDLHLHTTASDGLLDPAGLVRLLREAGVDAFSVTDHDTLEAVPATAALAEAAGLEFVPGVEVSAYWRGVELHILGYYLDPAHGPFREFLRSMRASRHGRMQAMLSHLFRLGIAVPAEAVFASATDGNVGRPHLARVLVRQGVVGSLDEAFDRFLGTGRPAYVPRPEVPVAEAIRLIRAAGGLAALAHPGLQGRDEALPDLVAAGLEGLEAYHPKHSFGLAARYCRLAARHGLLVTGGSDFHGADANGGGPSPGYPSLPEAHYRRLRESAKARVGRARA